VRECACVCGSAVPLTRDSTAGNRADSCIGSWNDSSVPTLLSIFAPGISSIKVAMGDTSRQFCRITCTLCHVARGKCNSVNQSTTTPRSHTGDLDTVSW
jgi:hypothetical protein